ncbi:MAG: hypothetical protein OHK0022_07270 [Roseiflexaceae bacterium]
MALWPIVAQYRIGRDFELLGKVDARGRGHFKARAWKAPRDLGILEEAQSQDRCARLLSSEQFAFTRLDGPVLYQLVRCPMALHNTSPYIIL